jgi:hypothetical protein
MPPLPETNFKMSHYPKGGWATATGSTDPNAAVARVCAQQLANRKT